MVLQQITLQNILTRSSTTYQQYTTQQTESRLRSVQTSRTAYVMVYYTGSRLWENVQPCTDCIWFGLVVVVENHGYDRVLVRPSDFYVVMDTRQFALSEKGTSLATGPNLLPETVLFNGNTAAGWIIYQLPYDGSFSIVWNHPSDVLVYYQKSTSSTTLSPTT